MLESVFALRVSHTGVYADGRVNEGSVLISDLDDGTGEQRFQNHKVPVYVPAGGSLEIPLTSRALFSLVQGAIAGLVEEGIVTALVVSPSSALAGGTLSIVDVQSSSEFEDGSWMYPWKTIQRGVNALWGDPDDAIPVGPTVPEITTRIMVVNGGVYDEDVVLPVAGAISMVAFGTVSLGTATSPRGITRTVNGALNPSAPAVPVLVLSALPGDNFFVWGAITLAETGVPQTQNFAVYRGLLGGNVDTTGQTSTINLIIEQTSVLSPVFNSPTSRAFLDRTAFFGGPPTLETLTNCRACNFTTGYSVSVTPTIVMYDTEVAGTVTSPGDFRVDFSTNQSFADNAVTKAGGWAATLPYGRSIAY